MKYICKQCGKEFEITEGEAEFFLSKGMELPKRCKECRSANKMKKENDFDAATYRARQMPERSTGYSTSKLKYLRVILGIVAILIPVVFGFTKLPALIGNNSDYDESSVSTTVYTFSGYGTSSEITRETEEYGYWSENENLLTFSGYGTSSAIADETEEYEYWSENETLLTFRNANLLMSHYQKHGVEVGASSPEEYQKMAADVVSSENVLHKIESEDGDDVYFNPSTGEFVIVSTDGYIRTYYIADMDYFERQ